MKFSIITPTYHRPQNLIRCVESILRQSKVNFDFEVIIINDSPDFDYSIFDNYLANLKLNNSNLFYKIKYFINQKNMGVNFSRNFALDFILKDNSSDYTIFLDDDDWLHSNALQDINNILNENSKENTELGKKGANKKIEWLVTNRSVADISLTKNKTNKNIINYFYDYLILKRFSGDVTHVMKSEIATRFRFSTKIKNGEEWYYFIQIPYNFFYENINTTNSEGYEADGLNIIMQKSYAINTKIFWQNLKNFQAFKDYKFIIVLILRSVKILINKLKS